MLNRFFHMYGSGMKLKMHTAIYALALVLSRCVVSLIMGEPDVEVLTVIQMIAAALLFALVEGVLFPAGVIFVRSVLAFRTIIWAALCNLMFAGGAMVFRWYDGVPLWGMWLLLFVLEMGLLAMWFGMNVVLRIQTAELHRSLHVWHERH